MRRILGHAETKTVVIIQPCFFPWRGQFDLLSRADVAVFLDTVQYSRNNWYNRNRIINKNGLHWLTVPIASSGTLDVQIKDVRVANQKHWQRKMLSTLAQSYRNTDGFELYFESLEELLSQQWEYVSDIARASVRWTFDQIGRSPSFALASDLSSTSRDPVVRLIEICSELGAGRYLSGPSAKNYIASAEPFDKAGIELDFIDYDYPEYPQKFVSEVPLSVLDLLFNTGTRAAKYIWP